MSDNIKVLVVDDSVVIRRMLSTILEEDPEIDVVGIAQNGSIALNKIRQLKPDLVTLDVEMPEMDGLTALLHIREEHPKLPVVMFSTLTDRGADATLTALANGASDYVTKPANVGSVNAAMDKVREELIPKIKGLVRPENTLTFAPLERKIVKAVPTNKVEVIAIGTSTGGPNALSDLLPKLPGDLPVPVVIVQHMPPVFTAFLAQRLDDTCALTVHEAQAGTVLEPGHAYIAPGDYHMTLARRGLSVSIMLDQGPPENFCRPAVDVLFRSVADVYGGNVVATVLTGMGSDGRNGCIPLREKGAHIIAQDQQTSVVWGMPGAVSNAGLADQVLPLSSIGAALTSRVSSPRPVPAGG